MAATRRFRSWLARRVARPAAAFAKRHPLFLLAFGVCAVFALRPLWAVEHLPLLDWPQHVGLVSVVANAFDETSGTHAHYEPYAAITSYLTLYWGGALLAKLLGSTTVALKLILSVYFLALPASLASMLVRFGRSPWPGLLGFTAAWCWPLYMGFVAFVLALPLGFFAISSMMRACRSPRRDTLAVLAVLAVLLFFTHAMAYAWFVLVGGVFAVGFLAARRRWRALGRVALAATPSLVLFGIWFVGQFVTDHIERLGAGTLQIQSPSAAGGADVDYRPLEEKLDTIDFFFNEAFRDDADLSVAHLYAQVLAALIVAGAAITVVRRVRLRRWRPWYPVSGSVVALLFASLYFAMPMMANTIWAISPRAIVVGALGALLLVPPLFRRERWNALLGVPLVALGIHTANVNLVRFERFQPEADGFEEVMARAEPGRRLYGIVQHAGSAVMSQAVFLHWPAYYMDEPGGLVGFTFVINPTIPVRLRTLGTAPYPGRRSEWEPHRFRWDIYGPYYDYVLVRGNVGGLPMSIGARPGELRLVHSAGLWGLYENPHAATRVVYSFFENIHRAEVRQIGSETRACGAWDGHGYQCPHADWARVQPSEQTFARRSLPCVFVHPIGGETVEVRFDDVPPGGSVIRGFMGVADSGQHGGGADVSLSVVVDGETRGTVTAGSRPGYETFAVPVPASSGPREIAFEIRTSDDRARHFAFFASLLEEEGPRGYPPAP